MPRRPHPAPTSREPARRIRSQLQTVAPSSSILPATSLVPTFALSHLKPEQLSEIRRNLNWRYLFTALGLQRDEQKSKPDDWWARSPLNPDERTASFHMNDAGFFCFSSGIGGGGLELVQHLNPDFNAYDAARWLLERGISTICGEARCAVGQALGGSQNAQPAPSLAVLLPPVHPAETTEDTAVEQPNENAPIRQDLRPALDPTHPGFIERGIPIETLRELGAGFWQRKQAKKSGAPDPLNGRLVFQIRGLRRARDGSLGPVILSHMGRAVTPEQEAQGGKWCFFHGFRKSLELYNIDLALLDPKARQQARTLGHVLVVEGCLDVARLWSAGIKNVVASFGAHLSRDQIPRIQLLVTELGIRRFRIFYDRDQDGTPPHGLGARNAVSLLQEFGFEATAFDWNQSFQGGKRGPVRIPPTITDPAEFSADQIRWLRSRGCL